MCMSIEWRSLCKKKKTVPFLRNLSPKLRENAWALIAAPKNSAKTVEL